MSAVAETGNALAALGPAAAALPGGAVAAARRADALARLVALGLPTRQDAAWRAFNLRLLGRRRLAPAAVQPIAADVLATLPEREGATLLLIDGRSPTRSGALAAGVAFTALEALDDHAGRAALESRLGALDAIDERVRLLNAALTTGGGHLEVSAGADGGTVHLVHAGSGTGGTYARMLVTLAPNARLTLVEYHLGGAGGAVAAPVTDIELGAGAVLEHVSMGLAAPEATQLEDVSVRIGRDATYHHRQVAFGGRLARLDLRVALEGTGAEARLAGLLLADGSRELEVRTLVEHRAPTTRSDQVYRGVAGDRGRGGYDGKVVVHAGAQRADSRQSSRNLLLSREATIDTRPQLEINADDVKCSHGATTGALDENMLFYLLSRGLDRDTARALLTFAFAEDIVAGLPLPALRAFAEQRLLGSLPAGALIREFVR